MLVVKATLGFDDSEVGKTFQLRIALWGEDLPGDNLAPGDGPGNDQLYTFRWGSGLFMTSQKAITVSEAGTVAVSEMRRGSYSILDEDTGEVRPNVPPGVPEFGLPRKDEVFARVTLSTRGTTVNARSPTVIAGGLM